MNKSHLKRPIPPRPTFVGRGILGRIFDDPERPALAKKELAEVPQDRLDKSGAYPCVTPGITLYSWQDPNSDEEDTLRRTIFSNYIKE